MLLDKLLASNILDESDKVLLRSALVMKSDNISDYLYHQNQQEDWDLTKDFPNVAPPFERIWIEYSIPTESHSEGKIVLNKHRPRVGVLIQSEEVSCDGHKWVCKGTIYQKVVGGLLGCRIKVKWLVKTNGECCLPPEGLRIELEALAPAVAEAMIQDERFINDAKEWATSHLFVPFLTLSFLHCKNVQLVKSPVNLKLQKARQRRKKPPLIRWHTLTIEPVKRIVAAANNGNSTLTPKALHICRGHFKDFSERGLFGKYKGLYWWDAQVRGASKRGVVLKDYEVHSRKGVLANRGEDSLAGTDDKASS
ncbi:MAG: hypothetical protein HY401_03990 [Elusimicrobia bacterium]|nr:hypothetical protein [Elusimicrobiota bacterium]